MSLQQASPLELLEEILRLEDSEIVNELGNRHMFGMISPRPCSQTFCLCTLSYIAGAPTHLSHSQANGSFRSVGTVIHQEPGILQACSASPHFVNGCQALVSKRCILSDEDKLETESWIPDAWRLQGLEQGSTCFAPLCARPHVSEGDDGRHQWKPCAGFDGLRHLCAFTGILAVSP